jgi:predicted MarR family transcription regulator
MHTHQCDIRKEGSREILKTIGYVISLNKHYFKVKDLTNMLGIKPNGRHRLSYSLKALIRQELIEIYRKNDRNIYYIPVRGKLLDAYYSSLWDQFK